MGSLLDLYEIITNSIHERFFLINDCMPEEALRGIL